MTWILYLSAGVGCGFLFSKFSSQRIRWVPLVLSMLLLIFTYIAILDAGTFLISLFVASVVIAYLSDLYLTWSNHPSVSSSTTVGRLWQIFRNQGSLRAESVLI